MKSEIARTLFALVLILAAGVAWAAQPTAPAGSPADTPNATSTPAPVPAPDKVQAQAPAATEKVAAEQSPAEGLQDIQGLFIQPKEMGACCVFQCRQQFNACKSGCGTDPACLNDCLDQLDACTSYC